MKCPHGSGAANRCSQCIGCPVQVVHIQGSTVLVDGVAVRKVEPEVESYAQRRGGRR